ncbi:Inner membrane protein YdgK|nr:Inner membrane protein YdgK [Candidatus Pantoea persica]
MPLAWLIMTMLTSAMVLAMYLSPRLNAEWRATLFSHGGMLVTNWAVSLLTALAVWLYSLWVCWIFCQRSRRLPRHYIIWLLLALKTFAFTPVVDGKAAQTLLFPLLAAAVFVPYIKRSQRVKKPLSGRNAVSFVNNLILRAERRAVVEIASQITDNRPLSELMAKK